MPILQMYLDLNNKLFEFCSRTKLFELYFLRSKSLLGNENKDQKYTHKKQLLNIQADLIPGKFHIS